MKYIVMDEWTDDTWYGKIHKYLEKALKERYSPIDVGDFLQESWDFSPDSMSKND